MRKQLVRGLIAGAAGLMVLAFGTAHAAVSVSIDNGNGTVVYSLPVLPQVSEEYPAEYPSEFETDITGTASFDSTEGGVLVEFIGYNEAGPIQVYSASANTSCNETGSECTWSLTVPFAFTPGTYDVIATASEPSNPTGASDTVELTVL